jgi:predicted RNA polymerase sigma factor
MCYLMFNEGYCAHDGEDLIRAGLCDEAIRLCQVTIEHARCDLPRTNALLALMLLQHARRAARISAAGDLWALPDQDRGLWDKSMIAQGLLHLDRSAAGATMTEYHLQAGIAAVHAVAPAYDDTDWGHIVDLYDQLYAINPTPVVALNRAVAIGRRSGPQAGIQALAAIEHHSVLRRYHLLYAVLAEFWREAGVAVKAAPYYRAALECNCTEPERRLLTARLEQLGPASS